MLAAIADIAELSWLIFCFEVQSRSGSPCYIAAMPSGSHIPTVAIQGRKELERYAGFLFKGQAWMWLLSLSLTFY